MTEMDFARARNAAYAPQLLRARAARAAAIRSALSLLLRAPAALLTSRVVARLGRPKGRALGLAGCGCGARGPAL